MKLSIKCPKCKVTLTRDNVRDTDKPVIQCCHCDVYITNDIFETLHADGVEKGERTVKKNIKSWLGIE